jgi:hypothetical protein
MLTPQAFARLLEGMSSLLPYGRPYPESALMLAWHTLPAQAKQELSDAALAWAVSQYLQDPKRNSYPEPPHLALLRYLYRVGDGRTRMDWGTRFPPSFVPPSTDFLGSRMGDGTDTLPDTSDAPRFPSAPPQQPLPST